LFAPLLARPCDDTEGAAHPFSTPSPWPSSELSDERLTPAPPSTAPVTVAHTQSIAIPLHEAADRSARLRSLVMLGAVGALILAVVIPVEAVRSLRAHPANVAPPQTVPMTPSFVAPTPLPLPAQPTAVPPGAGIADTQQSPKTKTGSHTLVVLPRSSTGHRIFVDGRVVGSGPQPVTVKCGQHSIKIGSAGKARVKDLPCGGEITLAP
jgi:hypothetical protein